MKRKKKIHYKNEFELCYLRHQYLRKVKIDEADLDLSLYQNIVDYLSVNTYYLYKSLFDAVGLMLEDVKAISQVQLVNFLGLFALEADRKKMSTFRKIFKKMYKRKPNGDDLLTKNRNSFSSFLRQRMEDLVRICKQKIRNIKGARAENYLIFSCKEKPIHSEMQILENYAKLGYKKVNHYVFQSIKRKCRTQEKTFEFDGKWYIIININNNAVTELDLIGAGYSPYDSEHHKDPETILFHREENERFEDKKYAFNLKPDLEKLCLFEDFVKKNQQNPIFKEEVSTAKKKIGKLKKKLELNER